jgi:hypothetical protein
MPIERDLEDVLAKYPDFIEEGLRLLARQATVSGRRLDLLFEDRHGRKLIAELKWGPIQDKDIGQILYYSGAVLSETDPDIRLMLIGTRVAPSLRKGLDHHGIAWREFTSAELSQRLTACGDLELAKIFADAAQPSEWDRRAPRQTFPASGQSAPSTGVLPTWMKVCRNPEILRSLEQLLARGQSYTGSAFQFTSSSGQVRWYVGTTQQHAVIIQKGRFRNDKEFWEQRLGVLTSLRERRNGANLRFHLDTAAQLAAFAEVADWEAAGSSLEWLPSRRQRQV